MPAVLDNSLSDPVRGTPPAESELEISLFGPGFGECVVVHIGGGDWLIVDSCLDPDKNPAGLKYLTDLGVTVEKNVRLVVSTHWHDDHIRGLSRVFAAAESAKLVVSTAIQKEKFMALVDAVHNNAIAGTTGVDEWVGILTTLSARKQAGWPKSGAPLLVAGSKLLFKRSANLSKGIVPCEVLSLSPSDESFIAAQAQFAGIFPKSSSAKRRLVAPSPNHTSVVIWIQCGEVRILLGADLEETGAKGTGWTAIVESTARPEGKANIFKIPHHGSENGHHENVWKTMVVDGSAAMLTPFYCGKTSLPKTSDVTRIKKHAGSCLITNLPAAPKTKRRAKTLLDRAVLQTVKSIRDVPMATGQIRLRKIEGKNWSVGLFGTARVL